MSTAGLTSSRSRLSQLRSARPPARVASRRLVLVNLTSAPWRIARCPSAWATCDFPTPTGPYNTTDSPEASQRSAWDERSHQQGGAEQRRRAQHEQHDDTRRQLDEGRLGSRQGPCRDGAHSSERRVIRASSESRSGLASGLSRAKAARRRVEKRCRRAGSRSRERASRSGAGARRAFARC